MAGEDKIIELYMEISSKLGTVITGQATTNTRLGSLENQVAELTRTVRGFNGTPGLVTEVALLREKVDELKESGQKPSPPEAGEAKKQGDSLWSKILIPVIVSIVIFIIFDVIPHVSAASAAVK